MTLGIKTMYLACTVQGAAGRGSASRTAKMPLVSNAHSFPPDATSNLVELRYKNTQITTHCRHGQSGFLLSQFLQTLNGNIPPLSPSPNRTPPRDLAPAVADWEAEIRPPPRIDSYRAQFVHLNWAPAGDSGALWRPLRDPLRYAMWVTDQIPGARSHST
jgi:hypothetical protein